MNLQSTDEVIKHAQSEAALGEIVERLKSARAKAKVPLWCSFLAMLTLLLVTIQFILSRGSIKDPDIWWHLRNAQYLFTQHQLPRADMFSFTVAGHAWMNHEWLSEVPYYLGWELAGLAGIEAVMFAVIALIFLGLLYICYQESRNYKASVLACSFVSFLAAVSYGPRTILFGYLCLVGLLIIMQRFRQKGAAPLWLIPLLFCVWINTHGSWSLGVIMFCVIAAAGMVEGSWGLVDSTKWTQEQRKALIYTGVASAAALFVNPYGWRLVFYPLDLALRQKMNIAHVAEWVSVNFHDTRGKLVLVLLLALLASALIKRTRWTLAECGMVAFALYSGLTYIRFLVLLAIVIAPVLARILDFVPAYRPHDDTPVINAIVMCAMVAGIAYFWLNNDSLQERLAQEYPVTAVRYLKSHPPAGPLLNFYLWGGYLGWSNPDLKVFVDSRVDIFEYAGVFQDYLKLLDLDQSKAILQKYKSRYVLFPHPGGYSESSLGYTLAHDSEWKVIYEDPTSVLMERADWHP